MSVINKMLRDLDQRQSGLGPSSPVRGESAVAGAVALAALPATGRSARVKRRLAWGGGLLLAVTAMGGFWYQQSNQTVASAKPAVAATAPTRAPDAMASAPAVQAAPATEVLVSPSIESPPVLAKTGAVMPKPVPSALAPRQPAQATPGGVAVSQPVAGTVLPVQDIAASPDAASGTQRTTQAARGGAAPEALALAKSLSNTGSRPAAMNVLRQTLNQVEASSTTAGPVAAQSDLASLAVELARMELAEGQVSQALALLTRLEPQLSRIADAWAMRGNAAQRLGQHAQAVKSYQQALLLKPGEPRWMMGQAVSLAALGQISEAAELAEMTRVMGALRPEVANYLRQLGVAVRTD